MQELIVFTHNDLDALGCMLNIEYRFPDVPKKYFHTNYSNIVERVNEIIAYKSVHGGGHLVIPDVSFGDNRDALVKLYNEFDHVTHIDHHLYPEGFWDEFPNMKVVYDKTKCATLLCNEYLGNHLEEDEQAQRLKRLTRLIDVYDIWQKDAPEFSVAQDLNEFFWTYDIGVLCKEIVENGFKLPSNYVETVKNINERYTRDIASFEERKLIHRIPGITIAFIDDWFNKMMLKEHENGQDFVIGITSYGIIRIRVRQESRYTKDDLDSLRIALIGNKDIGHNHAFTYKVKGDVSFNALMKEAQRVTEEIGKL